MTKYRTNQLRNGGRIQSGVPSKSYNPRFSKANGLNIRGVVTTTYLTDDDNHPIVSRSENTTEGVAVYCDVLCYSSMSSMRFQFLPAVLVSQDIGGMHRGRVWKPRASSIDKTGDAIDYDGLTNPADLDGDHVLVGFIDDNLNQPVILRGIPHPSADIGNEDRAVGNRIKLKAIDGDPDFWKHHGSFYGISNDGDFVTDTRFANDGELEGDDQNKLAHEDDPPTDTDDNKGAQRHELPLQATHGITLYDMSDPDNPEAKVTLTLDKELWKLEFIDSKLQIFVDDENNEIRLGETSDFKAVLDEKLQDELKRIKVEISKLADELGRHRHPMPEFPMPLLFADLSETFKAALFYGNEGTPVNNIRTGGTAKENHSPMDKDAAEGEFLIKTPPDLDQDTVDAIPIPQAGLFSFGEVPGDTNSDLVTIDS